MVKNSGVTPPFMDNAHGGNNEDDYSFKVILMQHVKRILVLASKEFRGGYWIEKSNLTSGGVTQKERTYIPDTREEYSNAIDALHDILLPYFLDNPGQEATEMREIGQAIKTELDQAKKEFLLATQKKDKQVLSSESYEGLDKQKHEEYKYQTLEIHRRLFQNLNIFLKRNQYFSEIGLEE